MSSLPLFLTLQRKIHLYLASLEFKCDKMKNFKKRMSYDKYV